MRKILICVIIVSSGAKLLFGGENVLWNDFNTAVKPYLSMQLWTSYSSNYMVNDSLVDNRFDVQFRRLRYGIKGNPIKGLQYQLMLYSDYLGKDDYSSTKGSANTGTVKVWSAYITYKLMKNTDYFSISAGYLLPQVSRETGTDPWSTSSLDKSISTNYLREFITGKTNGMSPGINIGGMWHGNSSHIRYNIACVENFNKGVTQGEQYAPIILGSVFYTFGHTDMNKYTFMANGNSIDKKTYISVGIGGSYQGESDFFSRNATYSADIKLGLKGYHLSAEYNRMYRKLSSTYTAHNLLIRSGYNIHWKWKGVLEPNLTFRLFKGADTDEFETLHDGFDEQIDAGINWWLSGKKLKLNFHYIYNFGKGENNFFINKLKGTKKGELLVLGFQILL